MNSQLLCGGTPLVLAVVSAVSDWIERHGVVVPEFCAHPEFRFIQWGWRECSRKGKVRFLIIKLPSYQWMYNIILWPEQWCWHQRWVIYDGRWRMAWVGCQ